MDFPPIPEETRLARLAPPNGRVRLVLDTDTYNEVDDQFALVYALLSPDKLVVEAIYAAPFHNDLSLGPGDGMEKSYDEIQRLLGLMPTIPPPPVLKGSTRYLAPGGAPEASPAALDLVQRAMASAPDDPLYVVAIGAITNVASALLIEPRLIERVVVVWLGGHALHWPDTQEFNLRQDVPAARLLFDCGVPLVHVPCAGVTTHLLTTVPELEANLRGRGAIGDYLVDIVRGYTDDHRGWSKVLWDVATIAYLLNPDWVPTNLIHSPVLTDQVTWSVDQRRHLIRSASFVYRDPIFRDLFAKLGAGTAPSPTKP
jgi:inosine-uridine nucleoside N-ribohydrolase